MKGPLRFFRYFLFRNRKQGPSDEPDAGGLGFSLGGRTGEAARDGRADMEAAGEPGEKENAKKEKAGKRDKPADISLSLETNEDRLKKLFHVPESTDIVFRDFTIPYNPPAKASIAYIEGLVNSATANLAILEPLMLIAELTRDSGLSLQELIHDRLLTNNQVKSLDNFNELVEGMLTGMTVLFVDGIEKGFLAESKGWEHRSIATPQTEQVVRGPQEGFNEVMRINTALIRRRIKDPRLVVESLTVGRLSKTFVSVLHIDGLTNPSLVAEAKRRISGIDVDYMPDSGYLEQYIEDSPFSIFPQTASTERPDRVAAYLTEGSVAIIVDGSPFAILIPAIFTAFFHSPEDYYLRWPYGLALRLIRVVAVFLALFLPGIYVAVTTFHQEMLPTSLMFAIAGSREIVPFPVLAEILMMEASFELIREAGVRVPSVIGTTIGIVGALILGQAAVSASIVSPILVIVVAITALSSFAIPSFAASFALRILRFPLMVAAGVLGFFGLAAGAFAIIIRLVSLTSFGAPYMSTIAPPRPSVDVSFRGPLWKMRKRPLYLRPLDMIRQEKIVRDWSPDTPDGPKNSE